jgi:hypothetical protein
MRIRKFFLLMLFLFFAIICFAQIDPLRIKDSNKVNVSLFTNYQLKSPIIFTQVRYTNFNNRSNNYKIKSYPIRSDPFFLILPGIDFFSEGYSQFKIQNTYYHKYYPPFASLLYSNGNHWVDPTNPWSTNKPGEALILGSANYLLSKIFSDK